MTGNMEQRDINTIFPYEKNAKKHPTRQVEQIANSIREFGFNQPIVVDLKGVIIVGHGRYYAAKLLGMTQVPCLAVDMTEDQAKAYRLADNKLNESEWDMGLAVEELKTLSDELIELTGFDKDLLITTDERDDVLPSEVPARARLGDIWQLGKHRIMCGDSTKQEDVLRLLAGSNGIDMTFTSPPYNVGHNLGYEGKDSKYVNPDNLENYVEIITNSTRLALEYTKDVFINIQLLANNKRDVLLWLAGLANNFKDLFFWKKTQVAPAMAENVANSQVELIVLFGKDNNTRRWGNKAFRGNFSNHIETHSASTENENSDIHNATFPVELPLKFIAQGYEEGSKIYDPFIGSGTTLIACEKTNRICYGMEIEPRYVDVILKRYEVYTGQIPVKL